jgi:TonB-linked SusC/RagA family outer membrane protein
MNKYKIITLTITLIISCISVFAQKDSIKVEGLVLDPYKNAPIEGAIVTVTNSTSTYKTDKDGKFSVKLINNAGLVSVWFPGYYTNVQPIANRSKLKFILIPEDKYGYSENMLLPFKGLTNIREKQTNLYSIQKNDINLNKTEVTQAFNNIPGLQVIGKSGMPGEGNYFSLRGVNTITANSSPLIVVNGVPYMPDMHESGIIGGFSRDALSSVNPQDIQNITVLKGADATMYGSMGSNGVIMIETDKAVDLDTKVEFIGQYGMDMNQATLPVMGVNDYKGYVSNVSLTKYDDMANVLTKFPYLIDDPNYYYNYKYNNNTDWQKQIYTQGFTTDNVLKIKGGDAIAKYDLSIGYKNKKGQLKGTDFSKYYARINSDVNLSRNISLFSSISMAYVSNNVQEQGMLNETNPLLASLKKGPLFSPFEKDASNNLLPNYAVIRDLDGNLIENNMVSNPLAIVNSVVAKEHSYDIQINAGLNYKITDYLSLKGIVGLYYYMSREDMFVPGVTDQTIMPLSNQLAMNTVRSAQNTTYNAYYNLNANYARTFNGIHAFKASVGAQVAMNSNEYDAGTGYNTANDFYKTLNNVSANGRTYFGYDDIWNWMNFNGNAQYIYNHQIAVGASMSVDGSSSVGPDAKQLQVYPALNVSWMAKNSVLKDIDQINKLTLRAEYVTTGNSRFSSSLSKYHYINKVFKELSGLTRAGIPNTEIVPELNKTLGLGLDVSAFNNRLDLTFDYYNTKNSNLIMPISISSAFGFNYLYSNVASTQNSGIEAGLQYALIQTKKLTWNIGGTITLNKNKVLSLGKQNNLILNMDDGSAIISEIGKPTYSFYGYQTKGVFATTDEASKAGLNGTVPLKNSVGMEYKAGDMHFVDQNNDGIIDDRDRISLGTAEPTFFGNFYTSLKYSNFELSANFAYSVGNKMYNATRRSMESMTDFSNQLITVNRRWMSEGQITDMPRASYGDPMGNSIFSDRWIEDASYLKLKEVMLSYKFNFMAGTTVFIAGENLFTVTRYLGLDPETMYSYDASLRGFDYAKIALPRSFKFGFKLQF